MLSEVAFSDSGVEFENFNFPRLAVFPALQ